MVDFEIRKFGDPVLKEKSLVIEKIDDEIVKLAKSMLKIMHNSHGLGLAAPQIGILKMLFVCDLSEDNTDPHMFINPQIISKSDELVEGEEGCLSVGKVRVNIWRPKSVVFKAVDLKTKEEIEIEADEWYARVVQHEIDHLNGKLIIDRASKEERKRALKELNVFSDLII